MSEPASRLPARPSLEQLRKRAKELLQRYRAGDTAAAERMRAVIPRLAHSDGTDDAILADAQFVIAREHGFESWAKLAAHIASVQTSLVLDFERLASELAKAYAAGEFAAIREINFRRGTSFYWDREPVAMQRRLPRWFASDTRDAEVALADARHLVARQFDADSWADLIAAVTEQGTSTRSGADGDGSPAPFYRIDEHTDTLAVRRPLTEKEWDAVFGVMKERRITRLDAGPITDSGLARLSALDHVTRLNLGGGTTFTDDGLLQLARMPQLRELDLSGWRSVITDRGLEALRHLTELRTFQMCWPQHVTDAGVANLAFCNHLESVDLLGTPTGDGAIVALAGKHKLRRFKTGRLVTDAGLPLLHRFPVFKTWQGGEIKYELMSPDAEPNHLLVDGPFTDKGFATLAGLDGLFGLSVFWHSPAITGDGLAGLANLPNLGFLGCEGKLCDDVAMRHIAAIPRLRMLMAQGTVASDDGFAALSRSQTIEYIWGRECPNLGSRGFAALAAMPALRGLAVSCMRVDDSALSALPRFPALTKLMPMDVRDEGFRHVGRCERLDSLWCMYCRDTGDAATEYIRDLPALETYYAGSTQITDHSLEILAAMESLERLTFWSCAGITNTGVAALARLPRLREINLDGLPQVTREAAALFPATVRVSYSN